MTTRRLNIHHRRAVAVLLLASALDVAFGIAFGVAQGIGAWHGLYCATGTATTVGCDVSPQGWLPHLLSALEMLTVLPLFATVLALFTTGLMSAHVDRRHAELKARLPPPPQAPATRP